MVNFGETIPHSEAPQLEKVHNDWRLPEPGVPEWREDMFALFNATARRQARGWGRDHERFERAHKLSLDRRLGN